MGVSFYCGFVLPKGSISHSWILFSRLTGHMGLGDSNKKQQQRKDYYGALHVILTLS